MESGGASGDPARTDASEKRASLGLFTCAAIAWIGGAFFLPVVRARWIEVLASGLVPPPTIWVLHLAEGGVFTLSGIVVCFLMGVQHWSFNQRLNMKVHLGAAIAGLGFFTLAILSIYLPAQKILEALSRHH